MLSRRKWAVSLFVPLMLVSATAFAAEETYQGFPVVAVVVNGKPLAGDVPGVLVDGHTMLPLRSVAEAVGANVEWDQNTHTATVTTSVSPTAIQERDAAVEDLHRLQTELAAAKEEITRLKAQLSNGTTGATKADDGRVEVVSYSFRKNRVDASWAYVEFQNKGEIAVEAVELSMIATRAGEIVATGKGSLGAFSVLQPQGKASVMVKPSNEIPPDAVLEWSLSYKPSSRAVPRLKLNTAALTKGDFGWAHEIGSVTNVDSRNIENVRVCVTFYDATGKIIYSADSTPIALSQLKPGQTAVFDATAVDIDFQNVANVAIYITGSYAR